MKHQDYTVGWISALPTEMAAAVGMLDELHDLLPLQRDSHDQNNYTLGRIGAHNVVLACLPAGVTGTISAANVAIQMLSSFKWLRFGLMVGIGGGVPSEDNDIRLGDVVVSQPTAEFGGIIQYDFGKTVRSGRFQRTGSMNRPPDVLLSAVSNLRAKHIREGHTLSEHLAEMIRRYPRMAPEFMHQGSQHDFLYEAAYDHATDYATCSQCDVSKLTRREPRSSKDPVIHYGLIASGDQVMRHGVTRDQLRRDFNNLLCFEMEAAGLMDRFPCLVIRGICDYADSHKSKRWQPYAAATAAAYAKELLSVIPGEQVIDTCTATEATAKVVPIEPVYHNTVLCSQDKDEQNIIPFKANQLSTGLVRDLPSAANQQETKRFEREVTRLVNDRGKAEEELGMIADQTIPPKSLVTARILPPRADIEDKSQILDKFFDYERILVKASETETFAETEAIQHLQSWTDMKKSGFLGVQGPILWINESPTQLIASHYVQAARTKGLPCISYFCSLSHKDPPKGRLRETIGLVALLYALLKQIISYLPLQSDHQVTIFQKARLESLDGTLKTWQDGLSLFHDLLQCVEPSFMLCTIHGLESLEHPSTQNALLSFMKVLRNHTEDHNGPESRIFKALFTTSGISQTVRAALREDELLDINRGEAASSPGRARKGRKNISDISFVEL